MKKVVFLIAVAVSLNFSAFSQIQMDATGKVGIGGAPSYPIYDLQVLGDAKISGNLTTCPSLLVSSSVTKNYPILRVSGTQSNTYEFYVSGQSYSSLGWSGSDERFKKNISDIDGGEILAKLIKIKGKKYEFKSKLELKSLYQDGKIKSYDNEIPNFPKGYYYGLIAQQIENEFPELVNTDSLTETKAINYDGMIPILLEGIKELQSQVEYLENEIIIMQNDCCDKNTKSNLKSAELSPTNADEIVINSENSLEQNIPNPFTESTQIKYFLNEKVGTANLYIYNMNGTQLKSIQLHQKGSGSVTINGGEFKAGMYMYTLIADGQVIDTKRMILTD